ncbi:unnamed protein product [Cuscuta europaea]|uniref:PLATZ transcription factor family protein n=1 Tax=Cuscuta europaea TaxID=41803 RepID=A0A9P0ZZ82_CUSEU|nr:unnamed protein product [Cuscuta europaea]
MQPAPLWLEPLLNTAFFAACRTHGDGARSECNMFCIDCAAAAFCFYCRSSRHKDHQVIQIRRSSYHDVVRVGEIERVLDISGVQTYVINSAKVMFLNQRPQPKTSTGKPAAVSNLCEICGRSLLDTFRFCSLGCKLVGIKRNGNGSLMLDAMNEVAMQRAGEGISSRRGEHELCEASSQNDMFLVTPPSNARRRKGIPRRSPFLS